MVVLLDHSTAPTAPVAYPWETGDGRRAVYKKGGWVAPKPTRERRFTPAPESYDGFEAVWQMLGRVLSRINPAPEPSWQDSMAAHHPRGFDPSAAPPDMWPISPPGGHADGRDTHGDAERASWLETGEGPPGTGEVTWRPPADFQPVAPPRVPGPDWIRDVATGELRPRNVAGGDLPYGWPPRADGAGVLGSPSVGEGATRAITHPHPDNPANQPWPGTDPDDWPDGIVYAGPRDHPRTPLNPPLPSAIPSEDEFLHQHGLPATQPGLRPQHHPRG